MGKLSAQIIVRLLAEGGYYSYLRALGIRRISVTKQCPKLSSIGLVVNISINQSKILLNFLA